MGATRNGRIPSDPDSRGCRTSSRSNPGRAFGGSSAGFSAGACRDPGDTGFEPHQRSPRLGFWALGPALYRDVAIKVLPDFFAEDDAYRDRFQQEARSVARLNHPNILNVFDFGQEGGVTFLVLELVEGGTLADRLGRPMELEETIKLLRPIASALDHAHAQGILHRDIKPPNILIHTDGTPVLADFGLAKMADSGRKLTASGTVLGTPEYMSPE